MGQGAWNSNSTATVMERHKRYKRSGAWKKIRKDLNSSTFGKKLTS